MREERHRRAGSPMQGQRLNRSHKEGRLWLSINKESYLSMAWKLVILLISGQMLHENDRSQTGFSSFFEFYMQSADF